MAFQSAAATEKALAEVKAGSLLMMKYATPTARHVGRDFVEVPGDESSSAAILGNTFLNFCVAPDSDSAQKQKRRSRSCSPTKAKHPKDRESTAAPVHFNMCRDASSRASSPPSSTGLAASSCGSSRSTDVDAEPCGVKGCVPIPSKSRKSTRQHAAGQMTMRSGRQASGSAPPTAAAPAAARNSEYTTAMLQNLPQLFTQRDLLHAMDQSGFAKTYDFCYVPVSFQDGSCRGYAFVNFKRHEAAAAFISQWHGSFHFCGGCHHKPLSVIVAEMQGLEALLAQPSMKKLQRVRNPAYRPFIAREAR
eukprot:CAMPEP_0178398376 /NCGR_PEP_ID=MMETSP0689_2-20121128/14741_1 /TAXON_ID=160604 /ORGANISM="Amphidinium massartii, Strain CS-259" /LENGTH=305 /DNA_ID=CAMNT_0020019137 /DNA_START=110 /DNA_END=1027 /DNA_ORIENTATION=-